uniref:guanylate cyclase n=1 Tax=Crocodylus porosus TaxID=8502 RepID=A0A7M4FF72_CROPO
MSFLPLCFNSLFRVLWKHIRLHQSSVLRSYRTSSFLEALGWLVLGIIVLSCPAHCEAFKMGLVGPWDCDPFFSKAFPEVAAKLAVDRINEDPSLDLDQELDYIILQEGCETSKALARFLDFEIVSSVFVGPLNPGYCDVATLLGNNWNKAIFSWTCINSELDAAINELTLARTLPSPIRVLFILMKYFHWAHIGIISSKEDIWVDTAYQLARAFRNEGLPVGIVTSMGNGDKDTDKALKEIAGVKIIIMCMHSVLIGGEEQAALLTRAHEMGITDGRYVFVPYDTLLYSLPYQNNSFSAFDNNRKLQEAYDAVLTITMEAEERTFYDAFREAKESGEIPMELETEQVSPLFGTIYDAIYFMAKALENAQKEGDPVSGPMLSENIKNLDFPGFSQRIRTDSGGQGLNNYMVLDTVGQGNQLFPAYLVDMSAKSVQFLGRPIHFPGGSPPRPDSGCWFDQNGVCSGGIEPMMVMLGLVLIFILVLCGAGLAHLIRNTLIKIQLVKGPNKILLTLDDLTFINPNLSQKFGYRPPFLALTFAKGFDFSLTHLYCGQGDWVWLKKFESGMKDLRHENVNPFMGFFSDCGLFAIVTEHCSRGSLEDLLRNEDVKLDWMFKSSLLMDLIKGIKYLHHRDFPHGRLKSRNCVVDGRFVLKITDYGYNELLEAQKCPQLLWTAPELLREPDMIRTGTFKGDIYSFSIILQEVIVRGPPYCTTDLPAAGRTQCGFHFGAVENL